MCGICGKLYFDDHRHVESQLIEKMSKTISHRGPDGDGIYMSGQIGLGHRRLSIIDLDTGKQPLSNENDQMWITYNGEIYNYLELRENLIKRGHTFKTKTDTEVILHLFEELGEKCLEELRGMFAFAIWDNKKKTLFLARDRVGIKPLYYTLTKGALIFASEIKALLQDPSTDKSISSQGIYEFLSCTYTPSPETVFRNIKKLKPGHYIVVKNGKIVEVPYWDLMPYYSDDCNKGENAELLLLDLLKDTVERHMISDVPVGFLLSGGIDSTAMLYFYQEKLRTDIKTFTIGFESKEFEDERKYARLAAKRYGVEHYETTITSKQFIDFLPEYIWFMEEPIFEPPGVSLYYVTKMAREHVKVLLSGEGGDEAFAGYQTYRNIVWIERMKRALGPEKERIGKLLAKVNGFLNHKILNKYSPLLSIPFGNYYFSRASSPTSLFNSCFDRLCSTDFLTQIDLNSLKRLFFEYIHSNNSNTILKKMLYVDTKTWLPDRLLLKADKMTMANSLELRVPLLDHKVLEFSAGLLDKQKLNGIKTKYIFKKILKNRIPDEIIKRKKAGFSTPYVSWLQNNKIFVTDILMDNRTTERGYFNKKAIQELLLNQWMSAGKYSEEIFNLLTLELWHRSFIDN